MPRGFIPWLIVSLLACAVACGDQPAPKPPITLTIATGSADGVYFAVGKSLAAAYNRMAGVQATAELRDNPVRNVDEIETGAVDLTLDGAGHAYSAFKQGTEALNRPHLRLRAIAVLFSTAVQIVARTDSGIRHVEGFRGRRVAVGSRGSSTDEASRIILDSYGLTADKVTPIFDSSRDVVASMRDRKLDGVFQFTPLQHSIMADLADSLDVRLIGIERTRIARSQESYPFLKTTLIPAGTYRGQTDDVTTVGTDILLLCRSDLPDQLVHDLTRTLFATVRDLATAHPAAAAIHPDRGPAASIPLHAGAARYYRERELLR